MTSQDVSVINEWLRERTEHLDIFVFSAHQSTVFYFRCSLLVEGEWEWTSSTRDISVLKYY